MTDSERPRKSLTHAEVLEVLRSHFEFPGPFPITIISRSGSDFYALLNKTLEQLQGEAPFTIQERASSRKNFASYRIEIFVESAETALLRKEAISRIDGILLML